MEIGVKEILLAVHVIVLLVLAVVVLTDLKAVRRDRARILDYLADVQQTPADTETIERWFERNAERTPVTRKVST